MRPFHMDTRGPLVPLRRPLLSDNRREKVLLLLKEIGDQRLDMDFLTGAVEPYLDLGCGDDNSLRPSSYSAGYRLIETGEIVCAIQLPASIAESAILRRSKISITLAPAGHIEVAAGGLAANEPIDDLVARMVTQANLHMEEATASDLKSFLHRLERSLVLVQGAIARMPTSS